MCIRDSPEATRQMVEIATIGRSLGVHLVLATQSPGEAIDESIQKNAQYRLCLRDVYKRQVHDRGCHGSGSDRTGQLPL